MPEPGFDPFGSLEAKTEKFLKSPKAPEQPAPKKEAPPEDLEEAQLIEEDEPDLEGFQTDKNARQEEQRKSQDAYQELEPLLDLRDINPNKPAEIKMASKQFVTALFGKPAELAALEKQLGVPTGKLNLGRDFLETNLMPPFKKAIESVQQGRPEHEVIEELRRVALKMAKTM